MSAHFAQSSWFELIQFVKGISFYDGHGIASWKIVYLLLGALAIIVGVCVLIWLPDSPVHAPFLTKEERVAALERVRDDQGGTENKVLKKHQIKEALFDVRTWLIILTTLLSESTPPSTLEAPGDNVRRSECTQRWHQQL